MSSSHALRTFIVAATIASPALAQRSAVSTEAPLELATINARVPIVADVDCAASVLDQAAQKCIKASSTPTFGLLFPYPGLNNVFVPQAFVGGGENNNATGQSATVGGGFLNDASGDYSTIAGGGGNVALGAQATVGGGFVNDATGTQATVGGGLANAAPGPRAAVGGGFFNNASGQTATIGGGENNFASGRLSTIGGGRDNDAAGVYSTVGGGTYNSATGDDATVSGGGHNTAQGKYSFAAGNRAKANHYGAFVWGDGQPVDKPSSTQDEFNVYASGGVRMFTNSAATTGVLLAPGGGSWSSVSDRSSKEHLSPIDAQAVLAEVVAMPISTWNYKAQDDSIRHMGPMAQDFHAAFGLGVSEKLIDTVDPDGVALAAIQGLHSIVQEKDAEIASMQAELSALKKQVAALVATTMPSR